MVYGKLGTFAPLAQSQQSLGVYFSLNCGSQNKGLFHYWGHIVNRDIPHKIFCGELQGRQYDLCRSLPHIFDKYNYPFQAQLLQRLNTLDYGNPFVVQVLIPLSNSDGLYPCRASSWLYQLPRRLLWTWELVFVLSVYPLEFEIFLISSLADKVSLNSLAFLCEQRKSLLLPLVAKQDYLQDYAVLNLTFCPYLNYNIHPERVQAQWN